MATVTGFTAARMQEIEDNCIVDGLVVSNDLILEKNDGSTINAGNVRGATGATGPAGTGGIVYTYDIGALALDNRQVSAAESSQIITTGLTVPTVAGRRYAYKLSGFALFEISTAVANIKVLHSGVAHTFLWSEFGGANNSYHDVNRIGHSWVAGVTNLTGVSVVLTRAISTGAITLDNTQGSILFELIDYGV